jgi:sulfur relay (sulfurtransferase) complex TusBCD TusD component (DsrE family)
MQLPRNVSPVSASFFGLQRLGIHLVLCVACSLLLDLLLALLRPDGSCTRPDPGRLPPSGVVALADHTSRCDRCVCVSSASLLLSAKLK